LSQEDTHSLLKIDRVFGNLNCLKCCDKEAIQHVLCLVCCRKLWVGHCNGCWPSGIKLRKFKTISSVVCVYVFCSCGEMFAIMCRCWF